MILDVFCRQRFSVVNVCQRFNSLPSSLLLLLDIIRMIAYRAETDMMSAVFQAHSKKPNARKLLSQLIESKTNFIPQPEQGLLRIQLLILARDTIDRALLPLIEELNATRTQFPVTELTLHCELPPASSCGNKQPPIR